MLQSRVVDVSKAGVRQSAGEALAMCSQFGVVRAAHPWRARDGQHHVFVEFQYKVSTAFRDRLAERTGFAVVRVGDSDALVGRFNEYNKCAQRHTVSASDRPGGHCAKRKAKKAAERAKDDGKSKGRAKSAPRPVTPAAVAALLAPVAEISEKAAIPPASPSLLDYGSPPASTVPGDASDTARPLSSPLALAVSPAHGDLESKSAGSSRPGAPVLPKVRHPLLDIHNAAPISSPPISRKVTVPSTACKPHPAPTPPPPPPSSSDAPAPATPASRQPLLDIRNVTPSTEQSLTPKEPRHILADLLVKNVTVQSFLTIATWYRDRNMLKQAAEIAKAALEEKRRRGELQRCDAMALNLFLSTVSTAYARACQPKESQKYMLEAARYINLAWGEEPDHDAGNTAATPSPQNGQSGGASCSTSNTAIQEPAAASSRPQDRSKRSKDAAGAGNLAGLPGPEEHRQLQKGDISAPIVARVVQRQDSHSRASPASSQSDSDSERTIVLPMEEVNVRQMTLAEILDMAGTLLKQAARLAADH